MRHFPDLICFSLLFLESKYRRSWITMLRIVATACFIWWNREFGLFFLGGSLTWRSIVLITDSRHRTARMAALFAEALTAAAVVIFALGPAPDNNLAYYNLMGLGAATTRWRTVLIWIAIWGTLLPWTVRRFVLAGNTLTANRHAQMDVAGTGIVYCALSSLYVLWNPSPPHASVIALCAVVPIVALIGPLANATRQFVAFAAFSLLLFSGDLIVAHEDLAKIFDTHVIFPWSFPGLRADVTADPRPIEQSLELIRKYQPTGRLVLISQYDSLLEIAAGRLSQLPYVDLKSAVVSTKMLDLVGEQIRATKAPFIFVDRDIWAERGADLLWIQADLLDIDLDPKSPPIIADEATSLRVGQLAVLGLLAREVMDCYQPVETVGLLQVWRRSCGAEK